jgi:hypothetical protein
LAGKLQKGLSLLTEGSLFFLPNYAIKEIQTIGYKSIARSPENNKIFLGQCVFKVLNLENILIKREMF